MNVFSNEFSWLNFFKELFKLQPASCKHESALQPATAELHVMPSSYLEIIYQLLSTEKQSIFDSQN